MNQPSAAIHSQHVLECISHSVAQTVRLGQRLGELLERGDVVLLLGEFGAGKTHLVKGVALGLGSDELVNSPSFVLINQYRAGPKHRRMPIFHVDLYRIEDPSELAGIGLDDALAGDGVCLIEWAERAAGWLPQDHLLIQLRHTSETKRSIRFIPRGPRPAALVEAIKRTAFA
ncbi:MAG TPA: tRNA (adenosine(37)-N6)-threonylcarbamoyltransferase complex ATPase subunit type 1 TsaE [Roseiflexaceae bacterium]|nr:tRNA (adenosine(37)-N6)-threonylcarbamoyltransferase complex ATPase subunit type 1 TsaE [Roseiflexaceae bacterium]